MYHIYTKDVQDDPEYTGIQFPSGYVYKDTGKFVPAENAYDELNDYQAEFVAPSEYGA